MSATMNGRVLRLRPDEDGGGRGQLHHKSLNEACNRFFRARGMVTNIPAEAMAREVRIARAKQASNEAATAAEAVQKGKPTTDSEP